MLPDDFEKSSAIVVLAVVLAGLLVVLCGLAAIFSQAGSGALQ